MTKKWDLETSNVEMELKIGIYAKNRAKQVLLKFFDYGQSQRSSVWLKSTVNGWRMLTWQCGITLGLMWQYVKQSRRVGCVGERGLAREARGTTRERYWRCVEARAREAETSGGAWELVWCIFWQFLVGFCLGLAVLSLYAFYLAVGWAERWYPRLVGTVGVTAVIRFCQWLPDEGEGSGRTPEMSTGTRKSEEWLWYHVKNIKWERKTE